MRQYSERAWYLPSQQLAAQMLNDASRVKTGQLPPDRSRQAAMSTENHSDAKRILIVDDEQLIADTLARILNLSGFVAHAVYSGEAALEAVPSLCPHIVITDVRMPGRNGIETGILIRRQCPDTRVVLFSGQAGVGDLIDQARHDGHGFELWSKPIHPRELVKRLREL